MSQNKYQDLCQHVITTCQKMNSVGINQGTSGNVSVRAGDGFLISASGISYDTMQTQHVVQMDLDGGYLGPVLPSSEWRMHMDLYREFSGAGAVVHTHSTYATALACLGAEIPAFHYMIAAAGGNSLRCAKYASFGTEALNKNMMVAMAQRKACLLANHGMICFDTSLDRALALAVEIEALCKQYFIACQAGSPIILSDREMKDIIDRFQSYGKQPEDMSGSERPAFEAPVRRDTS
jgi:L-fuculose-phosphate aldolase